MEPDDENRPLVVDDNFEAWADFAKDADLAPKEPKVPAKLLKVHRFLQGRHPVNDAILDTLTEKLISAGTLLIIGDRSENGEYKRVGIIVVLVFLGVALLRAENFLWNWITGRKRKHKEKKDVETE